jgi:glycerophosphoryl diester phosphodiesterase
LTTLHYPPHSGKRLAYRQQAFNNFLQGLEMDIIGHRGARFEAPENTLTGYRYALALGINRFETDLHLTKDGEVVVIHDHTVDRTTNGTGAVIDSTLAELQQLDARAQFPEWPETAVIPTLVEMLELFPEVAHFELEIKDNVHENIDRVIGRAVETLRVFGLAEVAMFTSSHSYALETARRLAPDIRRGLFGHFTRPEKREAAEALGASMVGFTYGVETTDELDWAHAAGIRIHGGPTNDVQAVEEAIAWHADAIYTDAPTNVLAQFGERGVTLSR